MIKPKIFLSLLWSVLVNSIQGQQSYTNSIGMEFVHVPAGDMIVGRFQPTVSRMISWGSDKPLNETVYQEAVRLANQDAVEGFRVSIPAPFYIGKYEVTQGQWKKIMRKNPSYFQTEAIETDANLHPVENVSWKDVSRFIKKLNRLEKGRNKYRLPTEFEWEFAARAGKQDDISWEEIRASAVIAAKTTWPIGKKKPNDWGIYDMLGNVWEWVQDIYNEKAFADPVPLSSGKQHVLKGGPFYGDVKNATYMTHAAGPGSGYDTGFRLVMETIEK